ncbi:carbohydrate-binding family 9-like protein [Candidatus Latescibacterota bacterium]
MRKNVYLTWLLLIIVLLYAIPVYAQTTAPGWARRYNCLRANGPIVIDGVGNELAWQTAPEVGEFSRFNSANYTGDNLKVPNRTTAKMLWDDENIYFLVAVDDPDIWSTMLERDKTCLCREETIEIFIDPDGDGLDYAEIHINCLGTINDIWIPSASMDLKGKTNDKGEPLSWDDLYAWTLEGMRYAVTNYGTVNNKSDIDNGSVFEFAMPWNGFGKIAGSAAITPRPGDVWRINVNRYERPTRDKEDLSAWAPLKRGSYHVPERFGYVTLVDEK